MVDYLKYGGSNRPPIPLQPEEVFSYARKTNNETNAKKSIADQHTVNFRTAKKHGLPLEESGVLSEKPGLGGELWWDGYIGSGLTGDYTVPEERRPVLTQIMNGVLSGKVRCIICYTQDRIWRDVALCKVMIDVLAQQGCLLYDKNGLVDISTPEGRTAVYNNASEAEKVRRKAKVDSERGLTESREMGLKVVNAGVLGFRNVLGRRGEVRHVEEEQAVANRLFRLFDSGDGRVDEAGKLIGPLSKGGIAELLMEEGYLWMPDLWEQRGTKRVGPTEKTIYTTNIAAVLKDVRYQGRQIHGRKEWPCDAFLKPGPEPRQPVVETALFERVQQKLNNLKRGANATRNSYALGGLIRCGVCGQSMYPGVTAVVRFGVKMYPMAWKKVHDPSWCWCTHDLPVLQHEIVDAYIDRVLAPWLQAEFRDRWTPDAGYGGLLNEIAAVERDLAEKQREHREDVPAFLTECFRMKVSPGAAEGMERELLEAIDCLKKKRHTLEERLRLVTTMEPHLDNIANVSEATRRDSLRAVLRWVAVVPSGAPPIRTKETSWKVVPSNDAGIMAFMTAWGTIHTAFIARAHVAGQKLRTCHLREATASESLGTFSDLPDSDAFYAGLLRSWRGRMYEFAPQDVAPGYIPGQRPPVAEFDGVEWDVSQDSPDEAA